ncbi:MAG TPA: calcium/proton exchanger [Gemmatimonadales bacterium]
MTTLDTLRQTATEQGTELGSTFVGSEHLFLAWLLVASGPAHEAALAAGITPDTFRALIIAKQPPARAAGNAEESGLSSHAQRVMTLAGEIAAEDSRDVAGVDDVLLALIREPRGAVARALTEAKLKPSQLRAMVRPRSPKRPSREKPAAPAVAAAPIALDEPPPERPRRERAPAPPLPPKEKKDRARRDPETDDIPLSRAPERPRLPPPAKPAPLSPVIPVEAPTRQWSWLWLLLIAIPVSIWLHLTGGDPTWIFVTACLGIVPLASLMATATDHVAERSGATVGALLNAGFGNATELIVAIFALRAGYIDLVKASLVGSILGNLLLILGLSFFVGGLRSKTLYFDRTAAGASGVMLALAAAGLVIPSMLGPTLAPASLISLSQIVAIILAATYLLSLVFSLRTHRAVYSHSSGATQRWPLAVALLVLALTTVVVAVESELLVDTIPAVTQSLHLSQLFLGLIIIPIIGNAAEHATAVVAARRGKTELAVQIAIGSSTQVALLVAPLLVLAAAVVGHPMTLLFPAFQVVVLGIGVAVSALITLDGESHWLEGIQLLALYGMIAAAAWFI